jgi:hypothetical protein
MTRTRIKIPQKRLAFLGCEGESERAYGALLNDIASERAMPLVVRPHHLNPGAGDPLSLVKKAIQELREQHRKGRVFALKVVMLDEDRCARDPDICRDARSLASMNNIALIWQRPDHEAFLLRHLAGCQQLRPPAGTSTARLRDEWPTYRKPMAAVDLALRINHDNIRLACTVEVELRNFLLDFGWRHD